MFLSMFYDRNFRCFSSPLVSTVRYLSSLSLCLMTLTALTVLSVTYSHLLIFHRYLVTIAFIARTLFVCLFVYLLVQSCSGGLPVLTPRYDAHQLHSVCRLNAVSLSAQHSQFCSLTFRITLFLFNRTGCML